MSFETDLREFATEAMDRLSVPGVSIGITTPDGHEVMPLGITALDTRFPIRNDTIFQVGSISKPFTATLVMALVEDAKLDLDVPVRRYKPDLRLGSKNASQNITLRQLLTHQAGFWGDWFDDFGLADDATARFCDEYWRLPQLFEPGEMWAYNNCGYILAGHVAALAAGTTFEAAVKQFVLDPLQMDHTFLSAADAIAYPVAVGHTNDAGTGEAHIARQFLRPRARNPAGGVLASVPDILTFADLHLGRRAGVLTPASIEQMHTQIAETYEHGAAWGLGFKVQQTQAGTIVGHGGATNGFRAALEMVPDEGFGVAVLTNSDSGSRLADEIVNWILARRLEIKPLDLPDQDLDENNARRLAGIYRHPYASLEIESGSTNPRGRLTTHSPYSENSKSQTGEWFGLRYVGNERFFIASGELADMQVKFWMHDDDTVRFLQAGGRLYIPGEWEDLEGAPSE